MKKLMTTSAGLALAYTWHRDKEHSLNKPVLVLTHALGMNQSAWEPIIAPLCQQFNVLTWDLPGHGSSAAINAEQAEFSHESLTQYCLELLDFVGVDDFYFAGTSIGGVLGLSMLKACPQRVSGMVLSNTGAIIGTADAWQARCEMIIDNGLDLSAREIVPRWFSETSMRTDTSILAHWQAELKKVNQHSYLSLCRMLAKTDLSTIKRNNVDVRLVAGALDVATPVHLLADLADQLGTKKPIVFPDIGHIPSVEAPDSFASVILSLMQD